jgi:hypothetical protein
LAGRQHGLLTIAQLKAAGLSWSTVSKRVAAGRLHRVHRCVYALGHARLSQDGRWMAAVLACGEGAALGWVSAGRLWEVWRGRETKPDVVSSRRQGEDEPRISLHTCRHLDPRDVTRHHGIPVTNVARTLVDLTDVLTPHQLANVIHEAAFRRRFDLAATRAAMARANGRHNLAVLEQALALHDAGSAGTRSFLEDAFLERTQAAGLPTPLVNTPVPAPGGSPIEADFRWPELDLCVEVDGPGHTRPRTRREDAARDERLRAAGKRVLRLPTRSP